MKDLKNKMPILIVEDDEAMLEFYRETFENTVFDAVLAKTLGEASDKLANQVFFCVLFDYRLKDQKTGLLIERVRQRPHHINYRTPFLLVSGTLDVLAVKSVAPHVEKIILKPFSGKYLLQELQLLAELEEIEKRRSGSRKILVVEDDAEFRALLCESLNQQGYLAVPAGNHVSAHKLVSSELYDCIILDLNLDGVDGQSIILGVCLQENQINKETPFIVMSGDLRQEEIPEFLNLAQHVLIKPFSLAQLPRLIEEARMAPKKKSA